ncbi:MAG: argininosuccinate lyase, partial [bacterium]|nr:argininosuccinate lyase [bacterium]
APYDLQGSLAHVRMLGKQGILKKSEVNKIAQGLKKIQKQVESGKFRWSVEKEDVHLNIEAKLIQMVGPTGGKIHTARSRNDQVATDLRLYTRDQVQQMIGLLKAYQKSLLQLAKRHVDTLLPGYTHLQRAQPISLAHHLLAYFEMAQRDRERFEDSLKRINVLPLGAGALAGTTFPIDRKAVAKELKFKEVAQNSLDAVSDRDFVVETLSNLALVATHLSRLAEEWIQWASQEFQFIHLPEDFCTGSSMMPQKMNPDVLELIRGKTGRVYGALMTLLTILKGLPLTYNKDLQEDKEPFFDAMETVQDCLNILTDMIGQTDFNKQSMQEALAGGYVLATDLADYLVTLGIPFRQSHHLVGRIVAHCQKKQKELKELSLNELKKFEKRIGPEVYGWLDESHAVDRRTSLGGTARKNVHSQIRRAENLVKK